MSPRRSSPLFAAPRFGRPTAPTVPASGAQPETPEVADRHQLDLAKGRRVRTRVAGVFLFLPLLARVRFDQLVEQADYPGSEMIPATTALLGPRGLKVVDQGRPRH